MDSQSARATLDRLVTLQVELMQTALGISALVRLADAEIGPLSALDAHPARATRQPSVDMAEGVAGAIRGVEYELRVATRRLAKIVETVCEVEAAGSTRTAKHVAPLFEPDRIEMGTRTFARIAVSGVTCDGCGEPILADTALVETGRRTNKRRVVHNQHCAERLGARLDHAAVVAAGEQLQRTMDAVQQDAAWRPRNYVVRGYTFARILVAELPPHTICVACCQHLCAAPDAWELVGSPGRAVCDLTCANVYIARIEASESHAATPDGPVGPHGANEGHSAE